MIFFNNYKMLMIKKDYINNKPIIFKNKQKVLFINKVIRTGIEDTGKTV